jgi:hypothetical protein
MTVQKTREFVFGTFNAKGAFGGMPQEHIRSDFKTLELRAQQRYDHEFDTLGLQEFWPARYSNALTNVMGGHVYGKVNTSAMVWTNGKTVRVLESRSHFGHGKVVVDGKIISDERPIEHVVVEDVETDVRWAEISGHPVPGAFLFRWEQRDGRRIRVPVYKPGWRKRRAAWRTWRANLLTVTKSLSQRGLPVRISLDANKAYPAALFGLLINGMSVKYVRNEIDWIIFVDSAKHKWMINRKSKWVVKALFSDHDAIMVKAKLVAK